MVLLSGAEPFDEFTTQLHTRKQHLEIKINFDQPIVDWLNQQYPARNWFLTAGVLTPPVGSEIFGAKLTSDTDLIKIQRIEIGGLYMPERVFWEASSEDLICTLRLFCECVIDMDTGDDVYLGELVGVLEFEKSPKWWLYGALTDGTQEPKSND